MMKILLVDDHAILLDGISHLLEKSASELVEKANTVDEALHYFAEAEFDILITDFNLIDNNGLDLIRKVKKIYPRLKIIVLSMHDEANLVHEILKSEVSGKILKKDSHHDLVEAIEGFSKGEAYLSEDINKILQSALNQKEGDKVITKREQDVLRMLANKLSGEEIAEELSISIKTFETHRKNIFKKTKTKSLEGLLKFAYANNLI